MTLAHTHSSVTHASIPLDIWHEAQPLLETWKALLQSLPGYIHSEVLLRRLENADVHCLIRVTWEYREQRDAFMNCRWAPETVLETLKPPPYDVQTEILEQFM